jgi:hypothetical protein
VRIDHSAWRPAELSTEVNLDMWRMLRLRGRWETADPSPGLNSHLPFEGYWRTRRREYRHPQRIWPVRRT